MNRRAFLSLTGAAASIGLIAQTQGVSAKLPQLQGQGRPLTDFDVQPDTETDQTALIQKAIDEVSKTGHPVFVPFGRYVVKGLVLPPNLSLTGVEGHSVIVRQGAQEPLLSSEKGISLRLSGLVLDGLAEASAKAPPLITLNGGQIFFRHVQVQGAPADGVVLNSTTADITFCRAFQCYGTAIKLRQSNQATLTNNTIETVGVGIDYDAKSTAALGVISNNRVRKAAQTGVIVTGSASIMGNVIEDAAEFGLRLGGSSSLGTFSAVNNIIRGAGIGIGVSNADGGYGVVTLNTISGAKNGSIRALNEGVVTGPDLARSSPEAFRNLAIAGNVAI